MNAEFPTLAEVVAAHRWTGGWIDGGSYSATCACGWEQDITNTHRTGLQLHGEHVESEWREARTIRTGAQLDALPEQSVVRNMAFGVVFECTVENDGSVIWSSPVGLRVSTVVLPALLIAHPDWALS